MPHFITQECSGCMLCRICPVWAISGNPYAVHVIKSELCIDCGVCGRICIREAVWDNNGRTVAFVPRKDWPEPVIDRELCSACGICVNACRKRALAISAPETGGDYMGYAILSRVQACVGCGICASECPLGAIVMEQGQGSGFNY